MPADDPRTKLEDHFDLPATGHEQHWDRELADGDRVREFLDAYADRKFGPREKSLLMKLIVASFNAALAAHDPRERHLGYRQEIWSRIETAIRAAPDLHEETVLYWSAFDGKQNPNRMFEVTPAMRVLADALWPTRKRR